MQEHKKWDYVILLSISVHTATYMRAHSHMYAQTLPQVPACARVCHTHAY